MSDLSRPPATHLAAAHLAAERLAALADEAPTAAESAHVRACPECRRELAAYVALLDLAQAEGVGAIDSRPAAAEGGTDATPPPQPAVWNALAATLRAEGLMQPATRSAGAAPRHALHTWTRPATWRARESRGVVRLAVAAVTLALVVGAGAAGRWSAAHGPWALGHLAPTPPALRPAFTSPDITRPDITRSDAARVTALLGEGDPTSDRAAGDSGATRRARDDRDAELLRARLAALDAMLPRVRAAAREAPQDPAVNQLYLAAYDAREAALRQLGRALPAGVRLTGY